MKRSISVMVGKGSVNHNSRKFHAANTDPNRSHQNKSYCDIPIKQIYHDLFDEAVERYNAKQTRSDRCIDDYYEKIRSGKQEKPFHEIILQIGNKDDMNAESQEGELAAQVLDEYMQKFQDRNPNLKVFSAHLHMDEATPHIHIDFVPFTTGSKRGLDTRVSLKQALAAQGFNGGSRSETEWNQWVATEKELLAEVMQRHGIEWEKLGTHEKHLSVLDFEKKMRTAEVAKLDNVIGEQQTEISSAAETLQKVQHKLTELQGKEGLIEREIYQYEKPEWSLPEPTALMSAKAYREKKAMPLIQKLKKALVSAVTRYHNLVGQLAGLKRALSKAEYHVENLTDRVMEEKSINKNLNEKLQDFKKLGKFLGEEKLQGMLEQARTAELELKRNRSRDDYSR